MDGGDTGGLMQSNDDWSVFAQRMKLKNEQNNIQLQNV